jgi:hypothetical protein
MLVNLHLLWRNGLVATPLSELAASLTPSDFLLSNANKEAALIHSRNIAKGAKPFALSHVLEEGMFQALKAARFACVFAKYRMRNTV